MHVYTYCRHQILSSGQTLKETPCKAFHSFLTKKNKKPLLFMATKCFSNEFLFHNFVFKCIALYYKRVSSRKIRIHLTPPSGFVQSSKSLLLDDVSSFCMTFKVLKALKVKHRCSVDFLIVVPLRSTY